VEPDTQSFALYLGVGLICLAWIGLMIVG